MRQRDGEQDADVGVGTPPTEDFDLDARGLGVTVIVEVLAEEWAIRDRTAPPPRFSTGRPWIEP